MKRTRPITLQNYSVNPIRRKLVDSYRQELKDIKNISDITGLSTEKVIPVYYLEKDIYLTCKRLVIDE